jgi:hypothetical protein
VDTIISPHNLTDIKKCLTILRQIAKVGNARKDAADGTDKYNIEQLHRREHFQKSHELHFGRGLVDTASFDLT